VRFDPQTPLSEQDLTLAIYDAVTCPELWADVANALQRFVLCDTVDFMLLDGSTGEQIITTSAAMTSTGDVTTRLTFPGPIPVLRARQPSRPL